MDKHIERTAELAMIRMIPTSLAEKPYPGRLMNLLGRLKKAVDIELRNTPHMSQREKDEALATVYRFGEVSGWGNKNKHIITMVSFCLYMVEESKFDYSEKVTQHLNEIFEYFERAKEAKPACFVGGKIAYEKWLKTFKEGEND